MKVLAGSRSISCTSVLGGVALTVVLSPVPTATAGQLPVPCFTGTCAPNKTPGFNYPGSGGTVTGPSGFVQSGQAAATQSGNTLTVTQSSNQAILNWSSFNISAGGQVIFLQPSSTSVALNKIYQASPSSIFGTLSANGQIYLINPNGFVFGSTAQVNVGGLMAASLGLYGGDADLANGITSEAASARPALQSDGRIYVTDANGNPVLDASGNPQVVQIQVQSGASITAADGGRILLAGQQVTNGGTLTAPDGQIVLAAGQAVYLQSSTDAALRGLVVEVNNSAVDANNQPLPNAATSPFLGTVANLSGGAVTAARGNVSLIGYAVNQSGRISATTAVSANGSVILQAAQGAAPGTGTCDNGQAICATQGGTLTLGSSSDIEVLPEIADTTTTAAVAQPQVQSSVQLTGESVYIQAVGSWRPVAR
jgi:filamentous hemagglutinin